VILWLALGLVGSGIWFAHDGFTRLSVAAPQQQRRSSRTLLRLQDVLVQAGLERATPLSVLLFCVALGLAGGLLSQLLIGWPLMDLALGVGTGLLPLAWLRSRHARQRAMVQRALPAAFDQLRDALASGLSMDRALRGLAEQGPESLRAYFGRFCIEVGHLRFDEAVERLRDRLADPVFDLAASALLLHDEVGGMRFRACLDQLAASLRADLASRDRLQAARARTVYSARILAGVPAALLLLLRWWSPAAAQTFDGPIGQLLLGGCALAITGGYASMLWLARLPADDRVLVR
jgi:tight adherence protein B